MAMSNLTLTLYHNSNPKPNANRNPKAPFTRYNLLSYRFAGCQTGLTTGCIV